jgi:hypothetical protein
MKKKVEEEKQQFSAPPTDATAPAIGEGSPTGGKKKPVHPHLAVMFRAYDVFFGGGVILGALCVLLVVVWAQPWVAGLLYIAGNVVCELGIRRWIERRRHQPDE